MALPRTNSPRAPAITQDERAVAPRVHTHTRQAGKKHVFGAPGAPSGANKQTEPWDIPLVCAHTRHEKAARIRDRKLGAT